MEERELERLHNLMNKIGVNSSHLGSSHPIDHQLESKVL